MYRVSPLTYWVSGVVSTGSSGRTINCSANELAVMQPPSGQTCGQFLTQYATAAAGNILNPDATSNCQYCSLQNSDQYLAQVSISYGTRWRDFGLVWAYVLFNIAIAVASYYCFRVAGFKATLGKPLELVKSLWHKVTDRTGKMSEEDRKANPHAF